MIKSRDQNLALRQMLPSLGVEVATPHELVARFGLDVLAVTAGEEGAAVYCAGGAEYHAAGEPAEVCHAVTAACWRLSSLGCDAQSTIAY